MYCSVLHREFCGGGKEVILFSENHFPLSYVNLKDINCIQQ